MPYDEADLDAAYEAIDRAGSSPTLLAREIAGAIAGARREGAEAALAPFQALFSGGPDTPCRTTYRAEPVGEGAYIDVECVELPLDELRAAIEEAE